MNNTVAAERYQQYIDYQFAQGTEHDHPVIFLTDRETAMTTAALAMGPLAMMFQRTETEPFLPFVTDVTEHASPVAETAEPAVEAVELQVPTIAPERMQGRAAIYFAASQYSLN